MKPEIRFATTDADYAAFGEVCRRYVTWCAERYADMSWFVEAVFRHQDLDEELTSLPAKYGPPAGQTSLADTPDGVIAGGAWRKRSPTVCEMKRLFVTDRARGVGLGRRLAEALIASARAAGFETMQLDTADRLTEAIALYRSLGFERIAPYQHYPERVMPRLIFMELAL